MNNHLYSLDYIILALRLVIKHLDFNEENIFRYGGDRNQPPLQALTDYVTLILSKEKSEDSLPQFIIDFNSTPENIEKKLEITHNTLSKFSQEVMINGCLLDKSNLKVLTAWTLLCHELYTSWMLLDKSSGLSNTVQGKSKNFSTFVEENNFQRIFNNFLNTLCALGHQQTAEAFHLFLYLTHLVTLHEKNNHTTKEGMAKIQSICLTNSLELEGVLGKIDPLDSNPHYTALLKQENVLFSEIVAYLTTCAQFKKPFLITDYQPSLPIQFNTTLEKIIASIWAKPNIMIIPYSNDIFGAIPKSNRYNSSLPFIVDNSETVVNELRSRSQSPRTHVSTGKPERNKKSFDFFRKKASKSDEPIKTRKISSEEITYSIDKKEKTELPREKLTLPDLSMVIESKQKPKPVLPVLQFSAETKSVTQQKPPVPVHKSPRSPGRQIGHVSAIFNHESQKLVSSDSSSCDSSEKSSDDHHSPQALFSLHEMLNTSPKQSDVDELTQLLQSLEFSDKKAHCTNTSETEEDNKIYQRKKSSKEKRGQSQSSSPRKKDDGNNNECKPLLSYQYTHDTQATLPGNKKTRSRHSSKSKLSSSSHSTQSTSLK